MSAPAPSSAVVCAVVSDHPTVFSFEAAWEADHLLRGGGFDVLSVSRLEVGIHGLLPFERRGGTLDQVLSSIELSTGDVLSVRAGYISAHGAVNGLFRTRWGEDPVLTRATLPFFSHAVLVVSGCLGDELPATLCSNLEHVRAVIGYRKLNIPGPEAVQRWWRTEEYEIFRTGFLAALTQPIRSLLQPGCTARRAWEETRGKWAELIRDPRVRGELSSIVWSNLIWEGQLNVPNFQVWGDDSATLL